MKTFKIAAVLDNSAYYSLQGAINGRSSNRFKKQMLFSRKEIQCQRFIKVFFHSIILTGRVLMIATLPAHLQLLITEVMLAQTGLYVSTQRITVSKWNAIAGNGYTIPLTEPPDSYMEILPAITASILNLIQ